MSKTGIILGATIGVLATTLVFNSKKIAASALKSGRKKLQKKIVDMLDK